MNSRRKFLKLSALSTALASVIKPSFAFSQPKTTAIASKPIVISTWRHGLTANEAAWKILSANGRAWKKRPM
jgi:N4-(beta-N-acetylglucosaminyl)-L-asparaginase